MNSTADDLQALVKAAPFIDINLDADSPLPETEKPGAKADLKTNAKTDTETETNSTTHVGVAAEALQSVPEVQVSHPVLPLPIGTAGSAANHPDSVPADLYPALLRAHIALARVTEASRAMVLTDAPARFLLLKAAHSDHLLCYTPDSSSLEMPDFLIATDSASKRLRPVEKSALLLEKMSLRVRESGINKQLITELSIKSGNRRLLREQGLTRDSWIPGSDYAGADAAQLHVLLENWLEYVELSARNTDTLIVNAIAYHQFLSMSPFEAGNNAAALAIFQLLLVDSGVISLPILAISETVRENIDEHYSLFKALNEQRNEVNLHRWLAHCVELITLSATRTLTRIHGCRSQAALIKKSVEQTLSGSHGDAVAQLLIEQPVTRIRDFVDRGIAKRQTSSVYLRKLCDAGVLIEQQAGKEKLFLNNSYLQIFKWDSGQSV